MEYLLELAPGIYLRRGIQYNISPRGDAISYTGRLKDIEKNQLTLQEVTKSYQDWFCKEVKEEYPEVKFNLEDIAFVNYTAITILKIQGLKGSP